MWKTEEIPYYNKCSLFSSGTKQGPLYRFLVHRYSVLQQHAEADGVEALDSTSHAKSGYHDDSDEVRRFLLEELSKFFKSFYFLICLFFETGFV